jgi:hypothetical protein
MRHVTHERLQYLRKTHTHTHTCERKWRQHREWIECLVLQLTHIGSEMRIWIRKKEARIQREETGTRQIRSKRLNILSPYISYGFFQTKGEMCAKFGSDLFRNVNLYKVQTNKQTNTHTHTHKLTFSFIYKICDATTGIFFASPNVSQIKYL